MEKYVKTDDEASTTVSKERIRKISNTYAPGPSENTGDPNSWLALGEPSSRFEGIGQKTDFAHKGTNMLAMGTLKNEL